VFGGRDVSEFAVQAPVPVFGDDLGDESLYAVAAERRLPRAGSPDRCPSRELLRVSVTE
jgi:hypothetical protein